MIETATLLLWLREELRQSHLADTLERLLGDNTLNDDLRLLEFCHALWPDMPATWRGRPLTETDLRNAATAAAGGDAQSLAWLQSLLDGRCFDFYSRIGHTDIEHLGHRYRDAWAEFGRAWDEMIQTGAPAEMRQSEEVALPLVVATLFSQERRESLRRALRPYFQPVMVLLCEDWFLRFGTDVATLSDAQLLILRHLAQRALTNERTVGAISDFGDVDLQRLGAGVIVLNSVRRLLRVHDRDLVVRPGVLPFELRPGEAYRSTEPQTIGERLWASLGSTLRRIRTTLGHRRPLPVGGTPATPARPAITASARLVRVTAGHRDLPFQVRDEYYLALASWEAPEGWQVRVKLTQPSLFVSAPRLRIDPLPSSGRMLLLLTSDTRICVIAQRGSFSRIRTRPMEVRFEPEADLIKAREDLLKTQEDLLHPQDVLLPHAGTLMAPRSRIADVRGAIPQVSPRRITELRGEPVSSRRPTRAEELFAVALISLISLFLASR